MVSRHPAAPTCTSAPRGSHSRRRARARRRPITPCVTSSPCYSVPSLMRRGSEHHSPGELIRRSRVTGIGRRALIDVRTAIVNIPGRAPGQRLSPKGLFRLESAGKCARRIELRAAHAVRACQPGRDRDASHPRADAWSAQPRSISETGSRAARRSPSGRARRPANRRRTGRSGHATS